MSERKTALLFFQEDIEEAFHLWCDANDRLLGSFLLQTESGSNSSYYLVPTVPCHNATRLVWKNATEVSNQDVSKALDLLIRQRHLEIEGGYWMSIRANGLGTVYEIASIPHGQQEIQPST
jgi:hypothetical protein